MTWSEVPFCSAVIITTLSLYKFYNSQKLKWLFIAAIAAISAFLSRYIGLFLLVPIGLTGLLFLVRRQYKPFFYISILGVVVLIAASLYLYMNYSIAGRPTGIDRISRMETNSELLGRLFLKLLIEFKVILIIAISYFALFKLKEPAQADISTEKTPDNAWVFFLFTGFSYFIYLFIMRWKYQFDVYGNRLLGPFTLMIFFAVLNYLLQYRHLLKHLKNILYIMVAVSLIYHVAVLVIKSEIAVFSKGWHDNKEKYSQIPDSSVIIFGNLYSLYYNTHIQPASPYPYAGLRAYKRAIGEIIQDGETLNGFVNRLCTETSASNVYIDADEGKYGLASEQEKRKIEGAKLVDSSFEDKVANSKGMVLLKKCRII